MMTAINSCEVEIPCASDLLARGMNRDGLFQDGTKGRIIARNDGILEIADDKTVGGDEASRKDSTTVCFFTSCSNA